MTFDEIIREFETYKAEYVPAVIHHGSVVGILEKACGTKERRHLVLEKLTGKKSSKELDDVEWFALYHLVQPFKPEGGIWGSKRGDLNLSILCETLISGAEQAELPIQLGDSQNSQNSQNSLLDIIREIAPDAVVEPEDDYEPPF